MNTITITFSDGTRHQYTGVPDDVTPDAVIARAQQDFAGKKLSAVDRQPEGGTDVSGDSGRGDIGSDAPGVDRPDSVGVPKWGRENPDLYGVAGAAREALGPVIEGLGMAGGTIVGAGGGSAIGGPIGTVAGATAGGTLGYAAGKRLTRAADVALGNVPPESVDEAFKQTGSDIVEGATYEMGGQAAGAAIIKGVPYVMKAWRAGGPQKAKIAEIMDKNPASTDIVQYIEKGSGRIGKDKYAIEAIKQGFDDGVIATVKGSTRNDNAAMLRMVNVLKKAQKNARYGALNRPSDIVGNALAKRVSEVERIRRRAGSHLDSVAKSLKGKRVDYSGAIEQFGRDLEKAGVALVRTKSGKIKADFSEADFVIRQSS
ncbi:MAG: hypothetical protein ACE5E3_03740 [Mariprofundus sp.]